MDAVFLDAPVHDASGLNAILTTVNKTALLIAYERALESSRPDALISDPFAEALTGGGIGKALSEKFASSSAKWGYAEWPQFHHDWTAVRTRYIDDWLQREAKAGMQFVNLGAGMCTRTLRLNCLQPLHAFEVDHEAVNRSREDAFRQLGVVSVCKTESVDVDFADGNLREKLAESGYDSKEPTLWLLEGLTAYLQKPVQLQLMNDIIELSAPLSSVMMNYMEQSNEPAFTLLSEHEIRNAFETHGWSVKANSFGDADLSFGRYRSEYAPSKAWSFALCKKIT